MEFKGFTSILIIILKRNICLQVIGEARPDRFIVDGRGYSQVIRDMAASVPLEEGRNLLLNHLVTEVHYDQPTSTYFLFVKCLHFSKIFSCFGNISMNLKYFQVSEI